jgi:hypothetical protein
MELERVVNKNLRDLKQFGLIKEDDEGQVRLHLNRLAVACWEEGAKSVFSHGEKEVEEYDTNGFKINDYPSVTIAAKNNGVHKTTLYMAIWKEKPTKNGHSWKYK